MQIELLQNWSAFPKNRPGDIIETDNADAVRDGVTFHAGPLCKVLDGTKLHGIAPSERLQLHPRKLLRPWAAFFGVPVGAVVQCTDAQLEAAKCKDGNLVGPVDAPAVDDGRDEIERLKGQIKELTGSRPLGNPSAETLRARLAALRGDDAEAGAE